VVQDACLCALRAIGTFSDGNARTWMLTIVRNTAYSWLHKNRPPLHVDTPESVLIAQDDETLLEAAIAALPAPHRETLVLCEIHELRYREIAALTGASIGTVMSRLARARGRVISMMTKGTTSHSESTRRNAAPAEDLGQRRQSPPRIRHRLTTDRAN
jgi:RNA polymerase sigma-70 factor (ECF subfamily)